MKIVIVVICLFYIVLVATISIRKECGDLKSNTVVQVAKAWHAQNECARYLCKTTNLPLARNQQFAVAAKATCWKWTMEMLQSKNCADVRAEASQKSFPLCCQMIFCVDNSTITIYASNGKGEPLIIKQAVTNANLPRLKDLYFDDNDDAFLLK